MPVELFQSAQMARNAICAGNTRDIMTLVAGGASTLSGLRAARALRSPAYWPSRAFIIASTFSLTAARLKEAGVCIGGNSANDCAISATFC